MKRLILISLLLALVMGPAFASTKARWRNNHLEYYESTNQETVQAMPSFYYYDEFCVAASTISDYSSPTVGYPWVKRDVSAAGTPEIAFKTSVAGAAVTVSLDDVDEEAEGTIYWGDAKAIDITKGMAIEYRLSLDVLPTDTAEIVFGVCGSYAKGPDNITYSLYFTADGSGLIYCESDDNATDQSASSGVTVTAGAYHLYRIEAYDVTGIRFYIDGDGVATSTTFPFAATGANALVQPYICIYKAGGTGVGTVVVDAVRIWQDRS